MLCRAQTSIRMTSAKGYGGRERVKNLNFPGVPEGSDSDTFLTLIF